MKSVVGGHLRYFGVPGNRHALAYFRFTVSKLRKYGIYRIEQLKREAGKRLFVGGVKLPWRWQSWD